MKNEEEMTTEEFMEYQKALDIVYEESKKIDKEITKDLLKTILWAKDKINNVEGPLKNKEYILTIITGFDNMLACLIYTEDKSFTHYGSRSHRSTEAITLAVYEYIYGLINPDQKI